MMETAEVVETLTPTMEEKLRDVEPVKELRKRREALEREHDGAALDRVEAEEALQEARETAAEAMAAGGGTKAKAAVRTARERLEEARSEEDMARRALERVREEEDRVKREEARRVLDELREDYQEAVQELHAKIVAAGEVNERVLKLYRLGNRLAGSGTSYGGRRFLSQAHWPRLRLEPSETTPSTRLQTWERWVESNLGVRLNGRG